MSEVIATKDYDNKVLILQMTGKTNSFTTSFLTTLELWLDHAVLDKQFHSVIITGSGNIFSVGGDLKQMKEEVDKGDPEGYVRKIVPIINRIIKKIIEHPIPIIAAINGSAAGGGLSLALSCDKVIAVPEAKFAFAFGALNLTPDSGSTIFFNRRFGYSRSLFNILTAKVISAKEAYNLNAIDELSDPSNLINDAIKYSISLKLINRDVISQTKRLLNSGIISIIDQQLREEYESIRKASGSTDFSDQLNKLI